MKQKNSAFSIKRYPLMGCVLTVAARVRAVILTLLSLVLSIGSLSGQTQQAPPLTHLDAISKFDAACKLYVERKFNQALDEFLTIEKQGYVSGELYYNIANAYYKIGDVGRAILYYERAKRLLGESDADIKNNLDLARLKTKDRIAELPPFFLTTVARVILSSTPLWLAALLLGVSLYGVIGYYILSIRGVSVADAAWMKVLRTVMMIIGVLSLVLFSALSWDDYDRDEAVVILDALQVRSEPKEDAKQLVEVHSGLKVVIKTSRSEWVEIRLPNGDIGWVKKSGIEVI